MRTAVWLIAIALMMQTVAVVVAQLVQAIGNYRMQQAAKEQMATVVEHMKSHTVPGHDDDAHSEVMENFRDISRALKEKLKNMDNEDKPWLHGNDDDAGIP